MQFHDATSSWIINTSEHGKFSMGVLMCYNGCPQVSSALCCETELLQPCFHGFNIDKAEAGEEDAANIVDGVF